MPSPAVSIPLKNISFSWTESSDRSRLGICFLTWADAENTISSMAQVAPAIGYSKTGFRIEWSDGERYEARLDITRAMSEAPAPLASHVRRVLELVAGRLRPGRMTEEHRKPFSTRASSSARAGQHGPPRFLTATSWEAPRDHDIRRHL